MKKYILLLVFLFLQPLILYAQGIGIVSGKLVDQNGNGLAGLQLNLYSTPYIYQTTSTSDGSFSFVSVTSVKSEQLPIDYEVSNNYPNPFNPKTRIDIKLAKGGNVRVEVYNLLGQRVINEIEKYLSSGYSYIDLELNGLSNGFYFAKIILDDKYIVTKKLILMYGSNHLSSSFGAPHFRLSKTTLDGKSTLDTKFDSLVVSGTSIVKKVFTNLQSMVGSSLNLNNLTIPVSAPPVPILFSPTNTEIDISTSPTFTWNSSTTATSYTLQVSTSSSFTSFVYNQSGLTNTSQQVSGLVNWLTYYWRVSATNSYGTSTYSSSWSFTILGTPPSAPTLSAPANSAVDVAISPVLGWNASTTATSYTLQVSTSNTFSSFVYNQSGLTNISQQVSGLVNWLTYYWRVSATNSYGTSAYSSSWSFTILGTSPSAPTLFTPANIAVDVSTSPTLTWNASSTATSYTLQVSTSSSFTSFVYNQSGLTNTSQQISGLVNWLTYYWRVSATNSYGTSAYSSSWSFSTLGTPPSVPTLSTPANSAVDVSISPELGWNVSSTATSYTLQVSTSSSFTSFVYYQIGLKNTSQQVSGLVNWLTYYWRVSATNSYGTSSWSIARSFTTLGTPPSAPTLSTPVNIALDVSTSPTLTWNSSTTATSYTLQVSTSSSFTSFVYNQSGLTNTSQQVSGLVNWLTYYWRVSATNSYGTSSWSIVRSFTTLGTPPSAPTLSTPVNIALDVSTSPTLTWNSSTTATSYTLQVSTSNLFTSFVYNQSGLTNTSQQVSGLVNWLTYYWRVSATNSYGTSAYSSSWSFSTLGIPPSVPTLSTPANSAVDVAISPVLGWNASTTATSYTLQVSTSSSFTSFVYNQSGLTNTSQQISGLDNWTTYYWRVSATNSYGTSAYSSSWSFSTLGIPPSVPTLSTPANSAVDVAISPVLGWNASITATSYTLQVSTSSSFTSFVYNQSGLTNTSQQVSGLVNWLTYYWRVSATNAYGTSNWSSVWSFTIEGTPPSIPILSSPSSNAEGVSLSPTFTWRASSMATSYTLQVSTNNSFIGFVYNQSGLTSTSQQVSGLYNYLLYYWRVSATNSYGTSGWSNVWFFITESGVAE